MFWLRTLQLGAKSLLLHPLRSLLTVLGIFIGVASVIWLLAIGEGISIKAQEQIADLGAENIIIRSDKPPDEATAGITGAVPYGLTREDFNRLVDTIPTIRRAIPIRELRRRFSYSDRMVDGRLVGCSPEYADVTRLEIDRGHFISVADVKHKNNHCVLAAQIAERLFPYENPLGRRIHVETDYYVVVGVLKPKTATAAIGGSLSGQEFSKDVYIPISTLWQRIGDKILTRRSGSFEGEEVQLNQITLRVDDIKDVLPTAEVVKATLVNHDEARDVSVIVPKELLEQAKVTRLMFILLMGMIAAISLVVGGIGIMNIMLATVTERTREIGIRRALGARRRDVIRQFLIETVVLSVVGGVTGIVGGVAGLPLMGLVRPALEAAMPNVLANVPELIRTVTPVLVPESIPIAFGISVLVGVVFGIYPAMRAADMDPIEALRHE